MAYSNKKSSLIVHVIDTGAGITKRDLPKIFDKFGKLRRTAEQNSEGIGLGLSIVKGIVEMANGRIFAYSAGVGKGSTFCFNMKMPAFQISEKTTGQCM